MSTITKKDLIDRITESTQAKRALVKATVQNFLGETHINSRLITVSPRQGEKS